MRSGRNNIGIYIAVIAGLLLSACSGMKYVPEGKVLYTGADIKLKPNGKVSAKRSIKEMMGQNITPKPNTSILGMRPGLWFYYIAGEDKKQKGLRHFIKTKMGQVPIYMDDVDKDRTVLLLRGNLKNNGFFQAEVKAREIIKNKKGKLIYTAFIHPPYRLNKISYPKLDTLFTNIDSVKKESYLKKEQRYNLERLQAEQERIEEAVENMGFYFFDDRHLIFEADSTVGKKKVDLLLTLEPGVPAKAKRIYSIGEITVFPNYTLSRDSIIRASDTLKIDGYNYVDRLKMFRADVITKVINIESGKIYRRQDREYTLSHLMSMGAFKFVDIKYEDDESDSSILNTNIFLTPYLKKSLRAEFQAVSKSNNFVGPGVNLKYTDRNVFKGAERFDISANAAYEIQISRKIPQPLNAFELGLESGLTFPRFITPFDIYYPTRKFLPTTEIKLGFRLQQRINYFRLNSFNLGYGYTWRENTLKNHELYPIDINYMRIGDKSTDFEDLMKTNSFLAKSLENQFIMGTRYVYTLNTQVNEERMKKFREQKFERSHFFFTAKVESAGNLVNLVMGGNFKDDTDTTDSKKIFGSAYSQFFRTEADFRYYLQVSKKNKIATRVAWGTGYAYGNSVTMPYIRQFSVGGSNSVRAFPARSIGPGTYNVRTEGSGNEQKIRFLDQRGDVKLEANAEFRFDIVNVLKGAVFMDAGNIWLLRDDPDREGEQFGKHFLSELAVGTGVGLRADFNFFVLRFDLAFPLRKPWLPQNERWVFNEIDLGSSTWRSENLILNIAIGYPF